MMKILGNRPLQWYVIFTLMILAVMAVIAVFSKPIWNALIQFYGFISDRNQIQAFIAGTGEKGPLVFIGFQVLQVIFAPVPGEATGFIGGYLFGLYKGFFYSSIGLTIGSVINFLIGRALGVRYVRKWVSEKRYEKYDQILKKKGVLIVFILFLFPGFPKDWLCLFLGVSTLSFKLLMILSTIGRMPGTFMLSIQGAMLFEKNYGALLILVFFCVIMSFLVYRYKKPLNQWIERLNSL